MAKRKKGAALDKATASAPNIATMRIRIIGESPYVGHAFSQKARNSIREKQEAGPTKKTKGKNLEPRDFADDYEGAKHYSTKGWLGMPAAAFRNAMIDACRLVNYKMTLAKLSLFVVADGFDRVDGTPLVKIEGKPIEVEHAVRLPNGNMTLVHRPMWREWSATLSVRFDADQFSKDDVANLLLRVGQQVGIGEGRYNSKDSAGIGWGCFRLG